MIPNPYTLADADERRGGTVGSPDEGTSGYGFCYFAITFCVSPHFVRFIIGSYRRSIAKI
jgi:hypothetical protein